MLSANSVRSITFTISTIISVHFNLTFAQNGKFSNFNFCERNHGYGRMLTESSRRVRSYLIKIF